MQFNVPGQWALHAVDSGHDYNTILPDEIKMGMDQHYAREEDIGQQCKSALRRLRTDWGEEGSEQRQNAERAFLFQLEHDPLYAHAKPAKESTLWRMYTRVMTPEG